MDGIAARKPASAEAVEKDIGIYNKMTPFFSMFLSNGFSRSHNGTEVHIVREAIK